MNDNKFDHLNDPEFEEALAFFDNKISTELARDKTLMLNTPRVMEFHKACKALVELLEAGENEYAIVPFEVANQSSKMFYKSMSYSVIVEFSFSAGCDMKKMQYITSIVDIFDVDCMVNDKLKITVSIDDAYIEI